MPPKKQEKPSKGGKDKAMKPKPGSFKLSYYNEYKSYLSMPPKKQEKPSKGGKDKAMKPKSGGGKAKKKKWSKGKTRDKLNNAPLFDKSTYAKLYDEVPKYKLITPSIVSERLKVRGSLARFGLEELQKKGLIKLIDKHGSQVIYTRNANAEDSAE